MQSDYLSGLLIGEEIREALSVLDNIRPKQVYLICKPTLAERYRTALSTFDMDGTECSQRASSRGLLAIARERSLILRSEEHTSELQSLMRISYAVFCLKKKQKKLK